MNPFQPLYDECNRGNSRDKHENLPEFPRMLDIELTSSCNFRCLCCPVGNLSLSRPAEFMSRQTYENILEQSRQHKPALRFIGWGEPTLDKRLSIRVGHANDMGMLTHLNTNGSKLTPLRASRFVANGLKSIKFSFQGVDHKTYREMRQIDFFDGLIKSVETMFDARGSNLYPYIAVSTTTTYESEEQIEEFRQIFEPICDQVSVGATIFDFMDMSAVRLKPKELALLERLKALGQGDKAHPECPEIYDKLSIHADGSVVVCCNDYDGIVELGNVNDTPIKELWRHPKIENYRAMLAEQRHDELPLCKDCYNYMGVATDATAME